MALLNNYFCKCYASRNFLVNFKNVIKLKQSISQTVQFPINLSFIFKRKFSNYVFFHKNTFIAKSLCDSNVSYMSRWIKCSSSGIHMSQSSKKKKRNKTSVFAEKVKLKFLSARRVTRRKVHKKIVEIKENVLTVPNALCAFRIISTPILGYLVLSEFYTTSLGIFILAGFTDLIDGYIARNFPNQQTMIGSFLDPAADKLLISTLFVTLTANGLIPVLLTSMILLRDACLMGAGFYIRYVSLPPPKTLSRYFDMSFVTARLSPTNISKVNTLIQLSLVAASLAAPVFSYVDHYYLHLLWYITGTTTVLSAASYLYYNNSTYKFFNSAIMKDKKR